MLLRLSALGRFGKAAVAKPGATNIRDEAAPPMRQLRRLSSTGLGSRIVMTPFSIALEVSIFARGCVAATAGRFFWQAVLP
jgi:hypothetical protein